MPPYERPSVSVCRRGSTDPGGEPLRTVVWVRGEHDIATREHLSDVIAEAALLDDASVAVDLSGVTFIDASALGALVLSRNRLRADARSLSVRAPSPPARRLLELCGLAEVIDGFPARPPTAPALESWVAVPAAERDADPTQPTVAHQGPARSREPARATAPRRREPAGLVQRRRAPS